MPGESPLVNGRGADTSSRQTSALRLASPRSAHGITRAGDIVLQGEALRTPYGGALRTHRRELARALPIRRCRTRASGRSRLVCVPRCRGVGTLGVHEDGVAVFEPRGHGPRGFARAAVRYGDPRGIPAYDALDEQRGSAGSRTDRMWVTTDAHGLRHSARVRPSVSRVVLRPSIQSSSALKVAPPAPVSPRRAVGLAPDRQRLDRALVESLPRSPTGREALYDAGV